MFKNLKHTVLWTKFQKAKFCEMILNLQDLNTYKTMRQKFCHMQTQLNACFIAVKQPNFYKQKISRKIKSNFHKNSKFHTF